MTTTVAERINTLTIDTGECSAWRSDRYNPGEKSPNNACITEPVWKTYIRKSLVFAVGNWVSRSVPILITNFTEWLRHRTKNVRCFFREPCAKGNECYTALQTPSSKLNINTKNLSLISGSKGHTFSYKNASHFCPLWRIFKCVEIPLASDRIAPCISEKNKKILLKKMLNIYMYI